MYGGTTKQIPSWSREAGGTSQQIRVQTASSWDPATPSPSGLSRPGPRGPQGPFRNYGYTSSAHRSVFVFFISIVEHRASLSFLKTFSSFPYWDCPGLKYFSLQIE